MAFRIPSMPLSANVWRQGLSVLDPPSLVTVCNLSIGRRVLASTGIPSDLDTDTVVVTLLLPALTDVRDGVSPPGADTVEVPAGSLRYYVVKQVDDVGKGFPNEFRFAVISKLAPWPSPVP
jgi:hypothetical protein